MAARPIVRDDAAGTLEKFEPQAYKEAPRKTRDGRSEKGGEHDAINTLGPADTHRQAALSGDSHRKFREEVR